METPEKWMVGRRNVVSFLGFGLPGVQSVGYRGVQNDLLLILIAGTPATPARKLQCFLARCKGRFFSEARCMVLFGSKLYQSLSFLCSSFADVLTQKTFVNLHNNKL